ncbi:MAG: ABC transporter ATP-binding protein [Pseudomonadota bacterium]
MTGITKSYRLGPVETPVLRGVDLTVLPGDFTSVMGPSGCGKSTLMNIMGLLDRPGGGSYRLLGQDVAGLEDRALSRLRNRSIGFVFQSYQLLARQDALGNVGLPLVYRGEDKPAVARRARRALELVGISDLAGRLPGELSGGQQQRVAIARALAGEPGLVLADEPTGALDSATGEEIMALFARLNREQGQTIVLITHDPKVAGGCRRRLRMSDGRLDETEPPQPPRPALGKSPGVMDAP